jgi:hypothetical protein
LLATQNRVNVVGTPLLLASNNRPAQVFVGNEAVLTTGINTDVVAAGLAATPVVAIEPITEVRNVGVTLFILPKINADRTITLIISQDNSTINPRSSFIPVATGTGGVTQFPIDTVNTANLQSQVVAKDGMTIAVGGLIRDRLESQIQKVPWLGDIKYLGWLFRSQKDRKRRTELVLLITPYIMVMPGEGECMTWERAKALSSHPYFEYGDLATGSYFENNLTPKQCRQPLFCPAEIPNPLLGFPTVPPEGQPPTYGPPVHCAPPVGGHGPFPTRPGLPGAPPADMPPGIPPGPMPGPIPNGLPPEYEVPPPPRPVLPGEQSPPPRTLPPPMPPPPAPVPMQR